MKNMDDVKLTKLVSISNELEFRMIKELLSQNNIPYLVKDDGAGGYMRIIGGSSIFGTDIMVNEVDFEKAHDLLESLSID